MKYLILTCAVRPNVSGAVSIRDISVRLKQYEDGFKGWAAAAKANSWKTVIVETTGYGAANVMPAKSGNTLEYFDFSPTETQRLNGKGAVEAAAINALVGGLPNDVRFVKATGRLVCRNASTLLSRLGTGSTQFDCSVRMNYRRPWVDTRLFAMNAGMWNDRFSSAEREVAEFRGAFLETVMGRLVMISVAEGCHVSPLPMRPIWNGVSGSSNMRYGGARQLMAARVLRPVERMLLSALDRKLL